MKLLFDQNISYRITKILSKSFPAAKHISQVGLLDTSDMEIWEYARQHEYSIVTFDSDYYDLSIVKGCPPKIIKTGTKKSYISRIERGKSDIQISTFHKLIEIGLGKNLNITIG